MGSKNFVDALVFYFTQRKIRANRHSIKDNLREHPFYPSINSISDTLRQFGVPNFSIDLTNVQVPSSETFTDMPKPFFCVVKDGKESEVAVVTDVTEGAITWYHHKRLTKSNWQEFASTWTGYLIAPFPKENAGENGFWKTRIREDSKKRVSWRALPQRTTI